MARIDTFLELAVKQGGSDLHLVAGESPRIRVHGRLGRVRFRELDAEDLGAMLDEIMSPHLQHRFQKGWAIDFSYDVPEIGRFRVAALKQLRGPSAVFRVIPTKIIPLSDLDLPSSVQATAAIPNGLTLVTGPTGSGKSTTLASIIDFINQTRRGHLITIEDPIEFVHEYNQCVITQREIGTHSPSFAEALKNCLREDPDAVLIGEMRDLETISLALTAAETGIQVLGTLHTNGAVRTIDRIINVFPTARQPQVRTMLSDSLRMVVSQQLIPNRKRDGRLMAAEVLVCNNAVASLVRAGKAHHLGSVMKTGAKEGMQSLDDQLMNMLLEGKISAENAHRYAIDKNKFDSFITRVAA